MKQVLIYADSLSWGLIPNTRKRQPFYKRWPGVFEANLKRQGYDIRVIENCLNGRRTVWSDPFKEGRNGSVGLAQVLEINSPLSLVIIMLGTNDFQDTHDNNAQLSAQGVAKLIDIIRKAPIEPEMPIPEIMIVAPPVITEPKGNVAMKFKGSEVRCIGLSQELEKISKEQSTLFFDSATVIESSSADGVHLNEEQHEVLGQTVAHAVSDSEIISTDLK